MNLSLNPQANMPGTSGGVGSNNPSPVSQSNQPGTSPRKACKTFIY